MNRLAPIPIIDLFAGPGGLGEGFSAFAAFNRSAAFRIALSIEMDYWAHQTLSLRSFFHNFPRGEVPPEYYAHLRGEVTRTELFGRPEHAEAFVPWPIIGQNIFMCKCFIEPVQPVRDLAAMQDNGFYLASRPRAIRDASAVTVTPQRTDTSNVKSPIRLTSRTGTFSHFVPLTATRLARADLMLTNIPKLGTSVSMVKATKPAKQLTTARPVESLIHVIRGQKVMLDPDLAALYQVEPRALIQAVRRNVARFPDDFMFQLSHAEAAEMRSQSVISSKRGIKYQPLAFTEHGVAMLSAVLRSDRAVQMSIGIIRAFVRMRELIASNKDIAARVEKLECGHDRSASVIEILVEDIDRLAHEVKEMKTLPPVTKRKIGFDL